MSKMSVMPRLKRVGGIIKRIKIKKWNTMKTNGSNTLLITSINCPKCGTLEACKLIRQAAKGYREY